MSPFHKLIARCLLRYDEEDLLVLADACEERELHGVANDLRAIPVQMSAIDIVKSPFSQTCFNGLHRLAGTCGMDDAMSAENVYLWVTPGADAVPAPLGACGLRWRGDEKLHQNQDPEWGGPRRSWPRTGHYRVCVRPSCHSGPHSAKRTASGR